jgi:hypothetical protein
VAQLTFVLTATMQQQEPLADPILRFIRISDRSSKPKRTNIVIQGADVENRQHPKRSRPRGSAPEANKSTITRGGDALTEDHGPRSACEVARTINLGVSLDREQRSCVPSAAVRTPARYARLARVRAAFFAAADRPAAPFVRAAFCAAFERCAAGRRDAACAA